MFSYTYLWHLCVACMLICGFWLKLHQVLIVNLIVNPWNYFFRFTCVVVVCFVLPLKKLHIHEDSELVLILIIYINGEVLHYFSSL